MITLEKYNNTHFEALNTYELNEAQANFTAGIDYCINERKDEDDVLKMIVTIFYENNPIGFFVLDRGQDKLSLTNNNLAIMIRSFSINPDYQGKGIGTQAMNLVAKFVKTYIPDINEIILSVNFKNKNAYQVYIKSGYRDENRTIIGAMGGQHVLSKKI